MKRSQNLLLIGLLLFLTTIPSLVFAQQTKTLDGKNYTVIDPVTYAFNADSHTLKNGERYVIDGTVMGTSGATLMLRDAGAHTFTLSSPLKLDFGTKVTIYIELSGVTSYSETAKVIKIEGPGIPSSPANTAAPATKTLDGKNYTVIDPVTYAFNADSHTLKNGERYVIDGTVMGTSGATLMLRDAGAHTFTLTSPVKLDFGAKVTIYIELSGVTSYSETATIIKLERK